jgi:hypothetical protein
MAKLNKHDMTIRLKRGTLTNLKLKATELLGVEGEPAYTTDTKQFFIHDGNRFLPPNFGMLVFYEGELVSYDNEAVINF